MSGSAPAGRRRRTAGLFAGILIIASAAGIAPRAAGETADASALYNAGTTALAQGDLGKAVAFLRSAERVDPRAADLRRNLAEARARAAAARGAESPAAPSALRLSPPESWWLAAGLLLAGAFLASVARGGPLRSPVRRGPHLLPATGHALLAAGVLLLGWLALRAREEWIHPEAIVVSSSLPVGPAPDERPRPPYLLGAGEEVRLGRARGALVEIRVAGTTIGWAERASVWRVADAPRYTDRPLRP